MIITIQLPLSEPDRELLEKLLLSGGLGRASRGASPEPAGADAPTDAVEPSDAPSLVSETPAETDDPDPQLLEQAISRATTLIRDQKRGAEVKDALDRNTTAIHALVKVVGLDRAADRGPDRVDG